MKTDYDIATILAMTGVERVANGVPVSMNEIAEHFGVSVKAVYRVKKNLPAHLNNVSTSKIVGKSEEQLKADIEGFLYQAAMTGNSNAAKILAQLKGWLVEKLEVKHGLSADEITRRNLEAERQLREGGYRVEEVQEKRPVLPEDLREDK